MELSLTWQMTTDEQMKAIKATVQVKLIGFVGLMCLDKHGFGKIVEDIKNAY